MHFNIIQVMTLHGTDISINQDLIAFIVLDHNSKSKENL